MANAQVLQNAVNRFASVAGFTPIAVDGDVGPRTLDATQKALSWVSIEIENGPIPSSVSNQAAALSSNAARSSSVLAANSQQVGAFLGYVADIVHLPAVYGPSVVGNTNAAVSAATGLVPMGPNPMGASVINAFNRLPTWQKAALGALGVLGTLFVINKVKQRNVPSSGY